jgi:molybdenum cofactor cytidylyltransferase
MPLCCKLSNDAMLAPHTRASPHTGKHLNLQPHIIVLAAGQSTRFGGNQHKLMQPWLGATLLENTLRHAVASHLPVVVVTTEPLAAVARQHVAARDVVVVPAMDGASNLPLGVGFSIAAGVSASPNAPGWLVLPADMPMIQTRTLQLVARQLSKYPVVFAQYQGRRGHPVGFAAELYSELIALIGDEGAKRLVSRYPAHAVVVDDAGVLVDVDTPHDLAEARRMQHVAAASLAQSSKIQQAP